MPLCEFCFNIRNDVSIMPGISEITYVCEECQIQAYKELQEDIEYHRRKESEIMEIELE